VSGNTYKFASNKNTMPGIKQLLVFFGLIPMAGCVFNTPAVRQGFATISQMQLNGLVQNIEFYKLQHAQYPDSLPQLRAAYPFVPIDDALQESHLLRNSYYNYKKIGDKYTVFSSGLDGIPHTSDDLFPQVDIPDSTKIGLIRLP
jgi:hypothetical protein